MSQVIRPLLLALLFLATTRIGLAGETATSSKVGVEVAAGLTQSPRVTVVVMLHAPSQTRTNDLQLYRSSIAQSVDEALAALPQDSFVLRRRFENVSAVTLDISAAALPALEANANVVRVDVDVSGGAQMVQAAPLARVSNVRTRGFTGSGVKTAVIDSGAQINHPDLADSIAGQQCFCSSATPGVGCCPSGAPTQSGNGSGEDGQGHGTNVTGIITGNGNWAPQGGAPDAPVVIVRVLDSNGHFYGSSDIVAALDWIASNHADVRVVNMSVGTNALFSSVCDNSYSWTMALRQAVAAVAANGTLMTASSGNQGSATSISAPACISGVIAVGATWDANLGSRTFLGCTDTTTAPGKPTCFTNSNTLVKLYAPGAFTTATGAAIDPYTTNFASSYGGTSQASPLVAACIADLFQLKPTVTSAQINSALASSSTQVTDPKNGLTFPHLDCEQALIHIDRIFANGMEM